MGMAGQLQRDARGYERRDIWLMREQDNRRIVGDLRQRAREIVGAKPMHAAIALRGIVGELIAEAREPEGASVLGETHDVVLVDGNAGRLQRAMGGCRPVPGLLHGPVHPIVVIAHDGMDAERCLEAREHLGPFARRNDARDLVNTRDIVAEQHDDIGVERIGAIDDALDPLQRHPGIAGMNVGDDGDLEREIRRPLPRGRVITGDAEPQRLDADAIGRGRDAERGQAADGSNEMTTRDHGSPMVMQLCDAVRLERNWGPLVQTACICVQTVCTKVTGSS